MIFLFLFISVIALAGATISLETKKDVTQNPAYVCSFCILALGLVEESLFQLHIETYLQSQCDTEVCKQSVNKMILQLEAKMVPEDICRSAMLCTDTCVAFTEWPIATLPAKPIEWPIERRLKEALPVARPLNGYPHPDLPSVFASLVRVDSKRAYSFWEIMAVGLGRLRNVLPMPAPASTTSLKNPAPDCGNNVSCHLYNFVDYQVPLQDSDGDWFSTAQVKRFRGTDWRGTDCNDEMNDVYPGRKDTAHDSSVDHNCNGISGGNATGSYEDQFCSKQQQRGIIIIGDSATAHFHIPPQWVTADGWNMDQLLADAANELDQPACSWGTGHNQPEQCPYQAPVPGVVGITSLYTQLRNRNRCNHNDYQNIGVNGGDVQSSYDQVTAMKRGAGDQPALVWLAMIGNDVCNGHPGFESMTKPDDFYANAMKTLTLMDEMLPSGSFVVALALFDGELLYATMHKQQHPIGMNYEAVYDFMNCEAINPCWGWLNSDRTARMNTTKISNSLNDMYQKISDTQTFKNFEFIFYNPHWASIFSDYEKAGYALKDLIEPVDGFHPSQAGNALFAQKFFEFLETEHPNALGEVNPFNEEIDKLFF